MKLNSRTFLIAVIIVAVIGVGFVIFSDSGSSDGATTGTAQVALATDPDPVRLGPATFLITVKDSSGKAVDNAKVYFDLNMTMMNMGTQNGYAKSQGNGVYAVTGKLTMQGPWKVSAKATLPGGEEVDKDFTVNVQ